MSVVKRIIQDSIERVQVDELLADEYESAGYGGITLTKTPLGTQINLFAMRPGRVIGKRGRAIKAASERLEEELGLPNPQITVVEVEVPEMNPQIMASRIANALERGVHFRRAIFWSLRRIMDSGAMGCEVILRGPLRSSRSRFEKVVEGYVPKSGDPALKYVRISIFHVKMKRGTLGVTVKIVPPEAKFPDKVDLSGLPDINYELPEPDKEPLTEEAPKADFKTEAIGSVVEIKEQIEDKVDVQKSKVIFEELVPEKEEIVKVKENKITEEELTQVSEKVDKTEKAETQKIKETEDLDKLKGVGAIYQKLLKLAGVKNIASLSSKDPQELLDKINEVNKKEDITKRPPNYANLEEWIKKASEIQLEVS